MSQDDLLRGGTKGRPVYDWDELADATDRCWVVLTGCCKGPVRATLEAGPAGHGQNHRCELTSFALRVSFGSLGPGGPGGLEDRNVGGPVRMPRVRGTS
jgi:hypothetical protein